MSSAGELSSNKEAASRCCHLHQRAVRKILGCTLSKKQTVVNRAIETLQARKNQRL